MINNYHRRQPTPLESALRNTSRTVPNIIERKSVIPLDRRLTGKLITLKVHDGFNRPRRKRAIFVRNPHSPSAPTHLQCTFAAYTYTHSPLTYIYIYLYDILYDIFYKSRSQRRVAGRAARNGARRRR